MEVKTLMSSRDHRSDELMTMALSARRKRGTKYAVAAPTRLEPTPQQGAMDDFVKSLSDEALKALQKCARQIMELENNGRLYRKGASGGGALVIIGHASFGDARTTLCALNAELAHEDDASQSQTQEV